MRPRNYDPSAARRRLHRYVEPGAAYLVTTNTLDRRTLFTDPDLARIIVANLDHYRTELGFRLYAYVVMPDHLHLVLSPGGHGLPDIMRSLKSFTAKKIREYLGRPGPVWQRSFHDRGIRDESQFLAALGYVHLNPVKAGLTHVAEQYEFSSAGAYAREECPIIVDVADGSSLARYLTSRPSVLWFQSKRPWSRLGP